jgi:hypothetical protein
MMSRWLWGPAVLSAVLLAGVLAVAWPGGSGNQESLAHIITPAGTPGAALVHLEIDADTTNGSGPCNPVDATAEVEVTGDMHKVAVCLTSAPAAPAGFQFEVVYNDTLNSCTDVANSGAALDDNPDANVGLTTFTTPDLGAGWDCDIVGVDPPACDKDPETGAGHGRARISCLTVETPTLPAGPGGSAPIAVVAFKAVAAGVDNLKLEDVALFDETNDSIVQCHGSGPCFGATLDVREWTPTPTPTPTATPTPDTGSGQVTISEGGEVTSDDEENGVSPSDAIDTTVWVPVESASNDATITITEMSASDPGVPPAPSDLRVLGKVAVIETTPEATFSSENPATLTITYDESVAPADESTIEVRRFAGSEWVPLGEPCTGGVVGTPLYPDPCISARDTGANSITIKTTSLSDWALMGPLAPVGGVAEYPDMAESHLSAGSSSSLFSSALVGVAAAVGTIAAGAWYARRRWLR